jgi:hypothetical protein
MNQTKVLAAMIPVIETLDRLGEESLIGNGATYWACSRCRGKVLMWHICATGQQRLASHICWHEHCKRLVSNEFTQWLEGREIMSKDFAWHKAVHDLRFWALLYCYSRYRQFPGVTDEEIKSYSDVYDFLHLAILEDDPLAGYVGEGDAPQLAEMEVGYHRLAFPFPEDFI